MTNRHWMPSCQLQPAITLKLWNPSPSNWQHRYFQVSSLQKSKLQPWGICIYYKTPNLWSKICVLFLCGRWARHCYITSLLTLHWSINNRPIQVANNRPIYVVGCTWPSNTCKVLYFWFGGQNDLLRTMWYFIIQLILHLYNIVGLVSGKIDPEIMDREFEKKWSKRNLFIFSIKKLSKAWGPHKCHRNRNPQVRCWDNGPRIWKKMVQKN